MPSLTFTALDGATVEISAAFTFPREGATSFVIVQIGSHRQEFGSGDLDLGDDVARAQEVIFSEEYLLQGGRLLLGSAEKYDAEIKLHSTVHLGVWKGLSHSLKTLTYAGTTRDLVSLFAQFKIEETGTGITLSPGASNVSILEEGVDAPVLVKNVPGLGLLEICQLTPDRKRCFRHGPGLRFSEESSSLKMRRATRRRSFSLATRRSLEST